MLNILLIPTVSMKYVRSKEHLFDQFSPFSRESIKIRLATNKKIASSSNDSTFLTIKTYSANAAIS